MDLSIFTDHQFAWGFVCGMLFLGAWSAGARGMREPENREG